MGRDRLPPGGSRSLPRGAGHARALARYAWAGLALLFGVALCTDRVVDTLTVDTPTEWMSPSRPQLSAPAPGPRHAPDRLIGAAPPAGPADVGLQPPPRAQACTDLDAPVVKSALRLSLVGAVVAEVPRHSLATIASGHERKLLGVGDRIGDAEVLGLGWVRIEGDRSRGGVELVAVICNEGRKEYVEPDASIGAGEADAQVPRPVAPPPGEVIEAGVRSVGPHRYDIDRQVLDRTLSDPGRLSEEAQLVASFKDGVANGVSVLATQPGALLAAIGVEEGDVVQRVNGFDVGPPERALELYQRLRTTSHASIDLERGGQPVRLEYSIKGL